VKPYPFSAIVGHDQLRLALLLCAVRPEIGGALIRGEKGTAKSTASPRCCPPPPGLLMPVRAPALSKCHWAPPRIG
jgi:hypothetical protein